MKFDQAVGTGEIESDDRRIYPFHCTEIADGSRSIDVATRVVFQISVGRQGRDEATAIYSR